MTTHYMDEAYRYCDRVAIIDKGEAVAMDSPKNLKLGIGKSILTASVSGEARDVKVSIVGVRLPGASDHGVGFIAKDCNEAIPLISKELSRLGLEVLSIGVRETTLDDVFLMKVSMREAQHGFGWYWFRNMLEAR